MRLVVKMLSLSSVLIFALLIRPQVGHTGCGCEKPPPAPAAVRPNVTYQGMPVTLFDSRLVLGQPYTVTFTPMTGKSKTVSAQALTRRDLADGVDKKQLTVPVPGGLPLGPTSLSVTQIGQAAPFLTIPDTAFTLAPQPIVVASQPGSYTYKDYQAAVDRNGVLYLSLDVTGLTQPRTIKAQAQGYPLRFTQDGAVFYNTQGFLMQLLNIPGLAAITPANNADSDILQYSRHEFSSYFLQHAEHLPHATDPTDGNWHLDGTRHVDHDHLILALTGALSDGALPAPGATPAFKLALTTHTLFANGLVGVNSISMNPNTRTDSYNAALDRFETEGNILSNGVVTLKDATVNGNATAASFNLSSAAVITGAKTVSKQPIPIMPVALPKDLPNLGSISIAKGQSATLVGPGSYQVSAIDIQNGGQWIIDNSAGPVTLYLTGRATISGDILTRDATPELFALYVIGAGGVKMTSKSDFYGVIYAPTSAIEISGQGELYGSFVGKTARLSGSSRVHFDTQLHGPNSAQ